MLNTNTLLEILTKYPEQKDIYFYHDGPVLYSVTHDGKNYLISLAEENGEGLTESYLVVEYPEITFNLLESGLLSPREFFMHPYHTVRLAVLGYTDRPWVLSAELYTDNTTIPDDYLPTRDARWVTQRAEEIPALSETDQILNLIYARIAPKIRIPGLNVKLLTAPKDIPAIDFTTPDNRIYASLCLTTTLGRTHSDKGQAHPDISSYRWEYMDCMTGSIIATEMDYRTPDEEVIAFFKHTLETDETVINL
jgi:hypothetical protein